MASPDPSSIPNLLKEALLPLATFVLGVISGRIRKWISIAKQRARFAYAKEFKSAYDAAWIIDSAIPEFQVDQRSIISTGQQLFLSIPDYAQSLLERNPEKQEEIEFHSGPDILLGFNSWSEIEEFTGIIGIAERVDRHRKIAADDALTGRKGFYFNSKKIGVRKVDLRRVADEEVSYLSINSFETDYFSHRVMQGVIREWLEENPSILPILRENESEICDKYFMFCTSLGMNAFILNEWRDGFTLVRRSQRTADDTMSAGKIHVTMNEGFSSIDFDHGRVGRGFITVDNCFRRGMVEELGISPSSRLLSPVHVFDVFFVPELFQFGLFGWAVYEGDWHDMKFSRAQDRPLEVRDVESFSFDRKTVNQLINSDEMVPYAVVGLEQLGRIFGVLTPKMEAVGFDYYVTLMKYLYRGLFKKNRDK